MKRPIFVYILECNDGSYYTGITNNVERRLFEHRRGFDRNCYTFERRPLACVHISEFANFDDAERFEKQIKKWSRAKKQAFIEGRFDHLRRLASRPSRRRVESKSDV